jgi:putative flippase GtrA
VKQYLRSFANRESVMQAFKVAVVGIGNTVVSFALFNAFLAFGTSWFVAVTLAFAITTFMSLVINRRWTFSLTDGKVSRAETVSFFGVNLAAYFATVVIMWIAEALFGPLGTVGYNLALVVAAAILILPKLAGYRDLVFRRALDTPRADGETAPVTTV